nr:hypothetical protein [Thauera sp.]
MPTNVAANLYNRGAKLQLINVSTWGVLWLVSRDPALKSLADLRGKELAMPFRGDMPDIVLQLLAEQQGMDVRKDLQLRYVASPVDAMQLLVMRRVDHALLAEPAASMALRKTGSFPLSLVAPSCIAAWTCSRSGGGCSRALRASRRPASRSWGRCASAPSWWRASRPSTRAR